MHRNLLPQWATSVSHFSQLHSTCASLLHLHPSPGAVMQTVISVQALPGPLLRAYAHGMHAWQHCMLPFLAMSRSLEGAPHHMSWQAEECWAGRGSNKIGK
jgi:hypothetical protein